MTTLTLTVIRPNAGSCCVFCMPCPLMPPMEGSEARASYCGCRS